MKPLTMIAAGIAIIAIDIRVTNVDVVPDVIGWLVCFWALLRLSRMHSWYGIGLAGAALGAGASMFSLSGEEPPVLAAIATLAMLLVIFGTCSGLMQAAETTDRPTYKMANLVRWLALVLSLAAVGVVVAGLAEGLVFAVAMANLVVLVWFGVLLVRSAAKSYAQPQLPTA